MKKRAVVIVSTPVPVVQQGRIVGNQMAECTKVVEIDMTLEELLQYATDKQTNKVIIIFESETPRERRPSGEEN